MCPESTVCSHFTIRLHHDVAVETQLATATSIPYFIIVATAIRRQTIRQIFQGDGRTLTVLYTFGTIDKAYVTTTEDVTIAFLNSLTSTDLATTDAYLCATEDITL